MRSQVCAVSSGSDNAVVDIVSRTYQERVVLDVYARMMQLRRQRVDSWHEHVQDDSYLAEEV